ncbi:hypothetical protein DENSPDRAFT_651983 [Dentipellis sp. KUC8613]|nr:hypothetical protein DENSPDRAFT_651983 [Dentipellis sp. KUC8613]
MARTPECAFYRWTRITWRSPRDARRCSCIENKEGAKPHLRALQASKATCIQTKRAQPRTAARSSDRAARSLRLRRTCRSQVAGSDGQRRGQCDQAQCWCVRAGPDWPARARERIGQMTLGANSRCACGRGKSGIPRCVAVGTRGRGARAGTDAFDAYWRRGQNGRDADALPVCPGRPS